MPAFFRRHRVALPLPPPPVLLACLFLLGASSHSAASGDDNPYSSLCLRQPSNCGNVTINYPFYTYNNMAVLRGNADSYCGYPGLAIRCDEDGEQKQAVLHIGDATYYVSNIDYSGRVVSLVDQDVAKDESCPRVDHNVTLPQLSWLTFPPGNLSLLFFLDCNFGSAGVTPPANTSQIRCGSFGRPGLSSFVWPGTEVPPVDLFRACRPVIKAPVLQLPDGPRDEWVNGGYGDALRKGFRLAWWEQDKPAECRQCDGEGSLGKCAFNRTGSFIGCLCSGGQVEPLNCTTYSSSASSSSSGKQAPFES